MSIGERIKGARVKTGMSQRDLARKLGISPQAISYFERNMKTPNSTRLLEISKILEVKIEYFFRSTQINLSEPIFRCDLPIKKKEEKRILAEVTDWLERYLTIEMIIGETSEYKTPEINVEVNSYSDVEQIAIELRKYWNLGFDSIDSLTDTLEDQGIKVHNIESDLAYDALFVKNNNNLPVIIIKKCEKGDRQRLSIAHELGHLLLSVNSQLDNEKVAYRFGAAFIFPKDTVIKEIGSKRQNLSIFELYDLKQKYGLSMQSILHRAEELEIISHSKEREIRKIFVDNNWEETEPGKAYPPEINTKMELLIYRALAEKLISINRAKEIMGNLTQIKLCRDKENVDTKAMLLDS